MPTSRNEKKLGMEMPITRRDFIGSTLVGAGSTLMATRSPGLSSADRPQFSALLGNEWTGPGGIGDYAASNGNTAEVVNAAHAIRTGQFIDAVAEAKDTGETFDLVVVGGGFSGLSAAYTFKKHTGDNMNCLILDNHPIFGGEAKQNEFEVDGYHLYGPQGSNGNLWPVSVTRQMGFYHEYWPELGLPDEFVWQELSGSDKDLRVAKDIYFPMLQTWEAADSGYFYGRDSTPNGGWAINPWNNGFRDAPIPDSLKLDYMTLESYRMPPRRDDWEQWLDSMTYLDFLTKVLGVSPEYAKLVDPFGATVGHGLGSDVTSAYAAFEFALPGPAGYFRYITDNTDPTDLLHLAAFPGGNAGIARYFLKHLIPGSIKGDLSMSAILFNPINWQELDRAGNPARFRGGCTVVAVENIGGEKNERVNVTYYKNGSLHKLTAKSVVMAANQAVNKRIVKGLTPELYDAMDSFMHGPVLTVNVAVRNWKFMEKLGITAARWFEGFGWFTCIRRQMLIDGREPMPLDPNKPTVLTMYVPFLYPGMPVREQAVAARYSLLGPGFSDFELQIREQLQTLFGPSGFDAKRDIAGIVLNRWGHAYVVQPPGFYFGKDGKPAAKDIIRNTVHGRIAFAHSELAGAQVWQTAAAEGKRAVEKLL